MAVTGHQPSPNVAAEEAWALLLRLANEHQDLALLVIAALPTDARRQLRASCGQLRRLVNEVSRGLDLPADVLAARPPLHQSFWQLDMLVLQQGSLTTPDLCTELQRQISAGLGRRLLGLRLYLLPFSCKRNSSVEQLAQQHAAALWDILDICRGLPQLRSLVLLGRSNPFETVLQRHHREQQCPPPPIDQGGGVGGCGGELTRLELYSLQLNPAAAAIVPRREHQVTCLEANAPGNTLPAAQLQRLQQLRVLSIKHTMTGDPDADCETLLQLPNLTRLQLLHRAFTGHSLGLLAALPQLQALDVGLSISKLGYEGIASLTRLTRLTIDPMLGCTGAQHLTALKALCDLTVRWELCDEADAGLLLLPRLTRLCADGIAVLSDVAVCTSLECLQLGRAVMARFRDPAQLGFSRLRQPQLPGAITLQSLVLGEAVSEADMRSIALHTDLYKLCIRAMQQSVPADLISSTLVHLTNLEVLELSGATRATNSTLQVLSQLQRLATVRISDAPLVTDIGLMVLMRLPLLEAVHLMELPLITPTLVAALLAGAAPSLFDVHISACEKITTDDAARASMYCYQNSTVTVDIWSRGGPWHRYHDADDD